MSSTEEVENSGGSRFKRGKETWTPLAEFKGHGGNHHRKRLESMIPPIERNTVSINTQVQPTISLRPRVLTMQFRNINHTIATYAQKQYTEYYAPVTSLSINV